MDTQFTPNASGFDNPPITLKDIILKIIRARWWILFSTSIILLGTIYVTFSTPPVYQSTASVMIERTSKAQTIFNFGENNNFKISDEIAVIKSRTLAEDVVKTLWNSNKRNRLYVFGTKTFIPRGQRLRRPLKKIFTFGKWSPEQNKPPQYDEPYSSSIGIKYYLNVINTINAYSKRGTNIIQITSTSPHPYEAALIANTLAIAYQKRDKEWSSNESLSLKSFLQERLNEKEFEMEEIIGKIEKYKKENEIYDINGNVVNLLNNLTNVKSQFNSNNLEINLIQSQKKYITEKLSSLEQDLVIQVLSSINAQLFALRTQVNEKEIELVRNATIYGSDHEAVVKTKENMKNLKNQLGNKTNELIAAGLSIVDPLAHRQELISRLLTIETELHELNVKSNQYQILIAKYEDEIALLPEKQSYLSKLERENEVLSKTYAFIRQKMEEARVSMASEPGKVRIINEAEQSNKPVSPDISRNLLMAVVLGVLLGFGINLSIEYFDNSIRSLEFIERKNLPILAIIPSIGDELPITGRNSFFKPKNKSIIINGRKIVGNLQKRMVTHENPKSPISEAYRSLRTSLMYTKKGSQGSIMVSSPGPGEGKTTTIINLAITYANLGKKTILVDGDLRKPVIHKVFDGNNEHGLTHYLSGVEENLETIIHSSNIHNLDIIYNGAIPPNPSELLGSELMKNMTKKLKEKYDIVLFDAPPIMAVTDAVVLSRLVDQFILVVRFGSTVKDSIDHALSALSHVETSLTGIVFNDLNQNNSYYSSSYYRYNQYYYTTENTS